MKNQKDFEQIRDDSKNLVTIDYYDRIHKQWIKVEVTKEVARFMQSDTSEMQKECINDIACHYGLSQMKYFNLITSRDTSIPKYDEVNDEFDKAMKVQDYYIVMFLNKFLIYANAPEDMINSVSKNFHYKPFLLKVIEIIKEIGIDKYKQFVDVYNLKLEEQQKSMTLSTPEDIISCEKETKQSVIS